MEELNIVPNEKVIEERQLSFLGHVPRMNEKRLAREIFEVRVPGKNEVGRLPKKMDGTSQANSRAERLEHWPRTEKHGREKLDIIGIHDK